MLFASSDVHGVRARVTPASIDIVSTGAPHERSLRRIFQPVITHVLAHRGVFVIHAASMRRGERGLLALGETGKGKSTIALAAFQDDWRVMGDDLVALWIVDDTPMIRGLPKPMALPSDVAADAIPRAPRRRDSRMGPPTPAACSRRTTRAAGGSARRDRRRRPRRRAALDLGAAGIGPHDIVAHVVVHVDRRRAPHAGVLPGCDPRRVRPQPHALPRDRSRHPYRRRTADPRGGRDRAGERLRPGTCQGAGDTVTVPKLTSARCAASTIEPRLRSPLACSSHDDGSVVPVRQTLNL